VQGKEVEGLPVENAAPAANEEFASPGEGVDGLTRPGWDPFQVWRTRVKASEQPEPEDDGGNEPQR
jgi:hypothetical protein